MEAITQNLKFIHQLTIQNKAYRKTRVLAEQPVIYQVRIPGQAYFPYMYISRMQVNFLGTKRILKVAMDDGEISATIPDAYEIDIVLRGLTTDMSNFIVAEMGEGKIDVSTRKVNK